MKLDICDRLRAGIQYDDGNPEIGRPPAIVVYPVMIEAAEEIERLRSELEQALYAGDMRE